MFVCTLKLDHNLSKKHSFTITDALVSCRRSTNDVPMLLIKSNTRTISYSLKENHLRISPMNMKGEFYFRSTHANGKINLIRQTESIEPLHRILSTLNNIGFDVKTLELYDENLPIEKPLVVVDKSVPFVSKANDTIAKPFPLKSIDCNAMTAKNVVDIDLTGTDIKSKVLQPNLSTTSIDSNRTKKRKAHIELTCIEDEPTEKILQQVVPSIPLYAGMAVDKRSKRLAISQRELQNLNFYLNQPSSNSDYNVEGIPNIGQTCYIAVILQMLYHSNVRKKLLSSREWVRSVLGNNTIFELVCDIFQRKLNRKAISLSGLQNQISSVCKRFKKSEQEDAHEFLITLLDQLSLCTIIRQDGDISLNDLRKKDPVNEFEFSMKKVISCIDCSHHSDTIESFRDMSLSVPGRDSENPTSMQSLIASYFKSEILEYKCQSCDGNRARATLSLASLPKSLILHIKRFDMGARCIKKLDEIEIPLILYLDDQLSRDEKGFLIDRTLIKRKYELIGIVNHRGHDIDFGHYTFNYHLPGDQSEWIIFDDAKVKKGMYCLESESKKDAYIVLYALSRE